MVVAILGTTAALVGTSAHAQPLSHDVHSAASKSRQAANGVTPALTCGTKSLYFDGKFWDPPSTSYMEGAAAHIRVQLGETCSGDSGQLSNFTTAWVMIAAAPGHPANDGWTQTGFENGASSTFRWFGQYRSVQGNWLHSHYSKFMIYNQIGVDHVFKQRWEAACTCERLIIDSTSWNMTPFNPFANWQSPFSPQFFGEASYKQNDIPGTYNAHTEFTHLQYQNYSEQYVAMPCGLTPRNDNPDRWRRLSSSCTAFDIWTP